LLENRAGLRLAVIVNDVAAVNVDGMLIKSQFVGTDGVEIAELQNGCVCCSLAADLLSAVAKILLRAPTDAPFDHIIVELSGVSEPQSVKNNWDTSRNFGHPGALRSEIAQVVTLVDTSAFNADWLDGRTSTSRNEDVESSASRQSVVELLAEQIEIADLVVLNKMDLVEVTELEAVTALVHSINTNAALLQSAFGRVELAALFPCSPSHEQCGRTQAAQHPHSNSYVNSSCEADGHGHGHNHGDHAHSHSHNHTHGQSPQEKYGIYSFVYKQRRPFHDGRFKNFSFRLQDRHPLRHAPREGQIANSKALAGLLRAKGVCWLDKEPLLQHAWSFAGRSAVLELDEPWWHACGPERLEMRLAYPGMQGVFDEMRREAWDDDGEWGDRRQELVFIGGNEMNEMSIREILDSCLLTDEEMDRFRKANLGNEL